MINNHKLGIVVPYRNRKEHLHTFKVRIARYLQQRDIPYEIIIINQDNAKLFNRGMLLNIGFIYAKKLKCDYVAFHDVDMIPLDVDYSYTEYPIHLATTFVDKKTEEPTKDIFDEYFGGVTMFPIEDFEKINGYSNKYWGWGYEDTDLLLRCKINGIKLNTLKIKNINFSGKKLKLNGVDAFIRGKNFNNILNLNNDLSFFISFYTDENIQLDANKESDIFTIFSIPGFNTEIGYNSFLRYIFNTFTSRREPIHINTDIKPVYKTNICVTVDSKNKVITLYQDGKKINSIIGYDKIYSYRLEPFFYIGCGVNQNEEKDNWFKGYFDEFAIWSKTLNECEVNEIGFLYGNMPLTQNGKKYESATKLKVYWNTDYIKNYKLVDLSGNDNDGQINNCEIVNIDFGQYKDIKIPYRRNGKFYLLEHGENGYENNKWKNQSTRWNQMRFHNEVCKNLELCKEDGLNDLQFVEYGKIYKNKITEINVGI